MKKYHYLTLSFLFLTLSCTDNTQQERIDELEESNQQLLTQVVDLNFLTDSIKQEYNYLTEVLDSLEYEIQQSEKDRSYLELVEIGAYQEQNSEDEDQAHGFNYRIEVYGAEIYKYFYISKIEYIGEMGRRQAFRNQIDIETLLNISSEQTGNVKFQGWSTPTEFKLTRLDSTTYNLTVTETGEVKLK
ncbi:hypothetical protein [Ekhidna sp.]|uniref:hypothetical protein n=1 Tax=Ekhidna sp. TaxID=2608089 RepID=UPI0032EE028A